MENPAKMVDTVAGDVRITADFVLPRILGLMVLAYVWRVVLLLKLWRRRKPKGEISYSMEFDVGEKYRAMFTPPVRAILHRLHKLDDGQVWYMKEFHSIYGDELTSIFEVMQSEAIQVEPGIFVRCAYTKVDRPNGQVEGGGAMRISVEQHKMTLYSYTLNAFELQEVANRWTKEYENFKNKLLADQQTIFMVRFQKGDKNATDDDKVVKKVDFHTERSFDNLFFEHKDQLLKEVNHFLNDKGWYRSRGITDALGILCYGPPGCGKTSFIKALLKHTKRHGVVFSINRHIRLDFIEKVMFSDKLLDHTVPQDDRIYVLEDIDAMGDIVAKRKTFEEEEKEMDEEEKKKQLEEEAIEEDMMNRMLFKCLKFGLTKTSDQHLGYLLNLLDGLVEARGRIVVMTTNRVDKLDPALIRPGRVDLKIEFKRCSREILKQIVTHFFGLPRGDEEEEEWHLPPEIDNYVLSPARVAQLCRANKHDFKAAVRALAREAVRLKQSTHGEEAER